MTMRRASWYNSSSLQLGFNLCNSCARRLCCLIHIVCITTRFGCSFTLKSPALKQALRVCLCIQSPAFGGSRDLPLSDCILSCPPPKDRRFAACVTLDPYTLLASI